MPPTQAKTPPNTSTPTAQTPMAPNAATPAAKKPSTKLIILAVALFFLGGPLAILAASIVSALLGDPAPDTTGRAIVNITMFSVGILSVIGWMTLGIILIIQGAKYAKSQHN